MPSDMLLLLLLPRLLHHLSPVRPVAGWGACGCWSLELKALTATSHWAHPTPRYLRGQRGWWIRHAASSTGARTPAQAHTTLRYGDLRLLVA